MSETSELSELTLVASEELIYGKGIEDRLAELDRNPLITSFETQVLGITTIDESGGIHSVQLVEPESWLQLHGDQESLFQGVFLQDEQKLQALTALCESFRITYVPLGKMLELGVGVFNSQMAGVDVTVEEIDRLTLKLNIKGDGTILWRGVDKRTVESFFGEEIETIDDLRAHLSQKIGEGELPGEVLVDDAEQFEVVLANTWDVVGTDRSCLSTAGYRARVDRIVEDQKVTDPTAAATYSMHYHPWNTASDMFASVEQHLREMDLSTKLEDVIVSFSSSDLRAAVATGEKFFEIRSVDESGKVIRSVNNVEAILNDVIHLRELIRQTVDLAPDASMEEVAKIASGMRSELGKLEGKYLTQSLVEFCVNECGDELLERYRNYFADRGRLIRPNGRGQTEVVIQKPKDLILYHLLRTNLLTPFPVISVEVFDLHTEWKLPELLIGFRGILDKLWSWLPNDYTRIVNEVRGDNSTNKAPLDELLVSTDPLRIRYVVGVLIKNFHDIPAANKMLTNIYESLGLSKEMFID